MALENIRADLELKRRQKFPRKRKVTLKMVVFRWLDNEIANLGSILEKLNNEISVKLSVG